MIRSILALSLLVSIASAEDKKAGQMDDVSKSLVDAWMKKEYNPGSDGLKKASFKIKVSTQGGMGAITASANYTFDAGAEGAKGRLVWDNDMVGGELAKKGWSVEDLNAKLDPVAWKKWLADCKLTATAGDAGTEIKVEGKNRDNVTGLTFDKDGVFKKMRFNIEMMGQKISAELTFNYKQDGDRYLNMGWDFAMNIPGMGKVNSSTKLTYVTVKEYKLIKKATETTTMGLAPVGTMTLDFTEHKAE